MEKRNNWFNSYQTIGSVKGQRDIEYRKHFFRQDDFKDSSVIDIGCNIGQTCFLSKELGASNVLGVDFDSNAIKIANSLKNDNTIIFQTDDIDNYLFYTDLPNFDVCLLLSVIGTQELNNKNGILSKLSQKTDKVMYIEGHHEVMKYKELFNMILNNTTFTTIEYFGETFDNINYQVKKLSRSFFRCSREELNENTFNDKIKSIIKNDNETLNAITGHGGSGKSYLKSKLLDFLKHQEKIEFESIINNHQEVYINNQCGIIITDDVPVNKLAEYLPNFKHKFVFDYRAVEYLKNKNITNLFHVKSDIKTRIKNRPQYQYDRSIPLNAPFIKNVYHISNM